jgi:hypothetical protein
MDKHLKKVDYGTDDEVESPVCAPCNESVVPVYCTYREAIAELKKCTSRIKENYYDLGDDQTVGSIKVLCSQSAFRRA